MEVQALFDQAAQKLVSERTGVKQGRIMHSIGLKTGGKFFAFGRKGELVVKLPAEHVTKLIASGAGQPFDAGKGRPMREWVCLRQATTRDVPRI